MKEIEEDTNKWNDRLLGIINIGIINTWTT